MSVAIVIVNWNSGELLRKCLRNLERQELRPDRIVVIDNASVDESLNDIRQLDLPLQVVELDKNVGFAKANNVAIELCAGIDWIATLNADAFPTPSWLRIMLAAAVDNKKYDFFACCMLQHESPEFYDGAGDIYYVSGVAKRRLYNRRFSPSKNLTREVFSPCAAAALYSRAVLDEVGGFDEDFFCYFEDVDLGFRLRLRGYRCLYVAEAVVQHVGGGLTKDSSDLVLMYGHRNLVWTYFKNMPLLLLCIFMPLHVGVNLVSIVYFACKLKGRAILDAKRQALRQLPKFIAKRKLSQQNRVSSWRLLRSMSMKLW